MKEFSFETIDDFDNHIEISIPNYTHIAELIGSLSTFYIKEGTNVYDLGCSTGLLLKKLSIENKVKDVEFIGYDRSDNLKPKQTPGFTWMNKDITRETELINTNLVLSIFTLQFIDLEKRSKIVNNVYKSLNKGGAFIVCEKIIMDKGYSQDLFTFSYYDYKRKNFTDQEILKKQMDLRSIMNPLTLSENVRMFKEAGFNDTIMFFQSLQFVGLIFVK